MHDFTGRPADLTRRVLAMQNEPACAVAKFAIKARSLRDNLELFELLEGRAKPMIALAMGEFGLLSRVLAPKFGGFLTFASLRPAAATAPGQPTVADLTGLYRFRSIGRRTKVYGIIGWPVAQSKSPMLHNAAFDAIGHDGVYLPLPIPTPSSADAASGSLDDAYLLFKATLLDLVHDPRLEFSGASVTIPHKENLVRLAREQGWMIDEVAAGVGAANTLVVIRDEAGAVASVRVMNTDVAGIVEPLTQELGSLAGMRAGVIGAGGAGRAAAYGLARAGAMVTILNRDPERARAVADELARSGAAGVHAASLESLANFDGKVLVNCTPVGMKGGPDPGGCPAPLDEMASRGNFGVGSIVFDTVYNPVRTSLLARSGEKGARTIDGVRMFVRQAAVQSHAWTGRWPDEARFDRLVRESLAEP
jgi:3-dehydroquinate dehydratase/shikimate dehydrogenase